MTPFLDRDGIAVYNMDARRLPDVVAPDSMHAVVTDPPYELGMEAGTGRWDSTGIAFDPAFWKSMLGLVRPGGFLLAFGAARTWHRLAVALEDAGWIIRDQIAWLYASGMPKGMWADQAVDRTLGHEDERGMRAPQSDGTFPRRRERAGAYTPMTPQAARWRGWNPTLKPAWDPIIVAQRPRDLTLGANLMAYGTGALHVGAGALPADMATVNRRYAKNAAYRHGPRAGDTYHEGGPRRTASLLDGRYPSDVAVDPMVDRQLRDAPPFYYASKADWRERPSVDDAPLAAPTSPDGHEWRDACARLGLDPDMPAYPAMLLDAPALALTRPAGRARLAHPTVKPVDLMRWLVRLACPPGGVVLEPFAGSGATLEACRAEGFDAVGVERDPMFLPLIRARMGRPCMGPLL